MDIYLLSPIFTFVVALVVVYFIYLIAGTLGPKDVKKTKYKLENYACGEAHPVEKAYQSYGFFHVAFFFTVLHVGALLIATAPSDEGAVIGIILIASMALTAFALFVGGIRHA